MQLLGQDSCRDSYWAVRQRFSILKGTLPIDFMMKRDQEEKPSVDHIIRVCCALNNFCDSIVPFD